MLGFGGNPCCASGGPNRFARNSVYIPGANANTKVTFPTVDYNGTAGTLAVSPSRIDAATQIAYFIVPATATTGDLTINIADADFPIPLQIVPTLLYVREDSSGYHDQNITIEGSGFVGRATTVNFGTISASGTGSVYYDSYNNSFPNGLITLKVPTGADFGPFTITTAGGTSNSFPLNFTQIEGALHSGNSGGRITGIGESRSGNHAGRHRARPEHGGRVPGDRHQRHTL